MLDVVLAFGRGELGKQVANLRQEGIDGARGGTAEQGFELGEDLFDGIEVQGFRTRTS